MGLERVLISKDPSLITTLDMITIEDDFCTTRSFVVILADFSEAP